MNRILPAIFLIATAMYVLSNLGHTPTAKAGSNYTVLLPLVANNAIGQTNQVPQQPDTATMRAQVIAAVNAERQKAGCAPVVAEATLTAAAQAWSDYMVANHSINHSDSVDVDWYLHHGYTRTDWLYENIAGGPSTGAAAVALWMSDEGHKAAILAGCANTTHTFDVGVGYNNQAWTLAIGELHN